MGKFVLWHNYQMQDLEKTTDTTINRQRQPILGIVLALLLATATFFSGLHLGNSVEKVDLSQPASLMSFFSTKPPVETEADLSEFWRVWELMEEKFALSTSSEELTPSEKVEGAIDGLVRAYGDPYTNYMPKSDAEFFDQDISGNFGGVGMEVGMRNGLITVISPLPETPAAKAGMQPGDILVEINGESTENKSVDEAVRKIRGEIGTSVELKIARTGEMDLLTINITREQIEIPTVVTKNEGGIFIISLYSFNAIAEMKMQQALREYVQSGSDKLILDLRGNPGGYLQGAVSIASYFLPAGKVVLREKFSDKEEETIYRSSGKVLKEFAPKEMVVLIDGGSASASEILAGALQQHGVATLIGQTSFGKGSVQELVPLQSGASLKVTIARWLTPDGTSLSSGGLKPDISVERTIADREASLDPQLETAVSFLKGTYVAPVATEVVNEVIQ